MQAFLSRTDFQKTRIAHICGVVREYIHLATHRATLEAHGATDDLVWSIDPTGLMPAQHPGLYLLMLKTRQAACSYRHVYVPTWPIFDAKFRMRSASERSTTRGSHWWSTNEGKTVFCNGPALSALFAGLCLGGLR